MVRWDRDCWGRHRGSRDHAGRRRAARHVALTDGFPDGIGIADAGNDDAALAAAHNPVGNQSFLWRRCGLNV